MNTFNYLRKTTAARPVNLLFQIIFVTTVLTACTGKYGSMVEDNAVTTDFQKNDLPAKHTFYYFGQQMNPLAVMGIDNKYTFEPGGEWMQVDSTKASVKDLVNALYNRESDSELAGSYLKDHQGNRMGIWFSYVHTAQIKMKAPMAIAYIAPVGSPLGGGTGHRGRR